MMSKNSGRARRRRRIAERASALALACLALAPAARAGSSILLPSLSKAFSPSIIGAAGTTTLTFTLTNPSGAPLDNSVSFSDTLPSGLIVGTPATVGGTCVNAAAATSASAGGGTITVTNLIVPAGAASCTVTVPVTNAEGQFNASCVSSPIAFTNDASNVSSSSVLKNITASCVTVLVPILSKAFSPAIINDGETTVLTFTLANPAGSPASSIVGFADTLPSGLMVASPPSVGGTCTNAIAATTATAGGGTVSVSSLEVPAGAASCTVTVNVTNRAGQGNTDCNLNPSAFTNFGANLQVANAIVSSEPACLVVNGVAPPPRPAQVPAASPAALALLAAALGTAGIFLARRRSG
jgi:uncharacterized repeat protein (TIGR01451 family)